MTQLIKKEIKNAYLGRNNLRLCLRVNGGEYEYTPLNRGENLEHTENVLDGGFPPEKMLVVNTTSRPMQYCMGKIQGRFSALRAAQRRFVARSI